MHRITVADDYYPVTYNELTTFIFLNIYLL